MEDRFEFVMNGRISNINAPRVYVYKARKNRDGGYWVDYEEFGDSGSMPFTEKEVKRNLEIGVWIKLSDLKKE